MRNVKRAKFLILTKTRHRQSAGGGVKLAGNSSVCRAGPLPALRLGPPVPAVVVLGVSHRRKSVAPAPSVCDGASVSCVGDLVGVGDAVTTDVCVTTV